MAEVSRSGEFGRYHVGEAFGGGPTGEVFRAKIVGVAGYERQYALKKFYATLIADAGAAAELAAAERAYATVSHPNIARLHEYGTIEGQAFAAVELVSGMDAARLLAGSMAVGDPIPRGALFALVTQVARGVAYAHARGVLHSGLCPSNVLIGLDGDCKVCDFGLLRARLRGRPGEDASLLARLPYLAPEQLEMAPATPQVDVFALATLAYELILGEQAFSGARAGAIAAAVTAGPPPQRDLPRSVWEVLVQAFALEPARRYANAGAFADAFEQAIKKLGLPGGRSELGAAVLRARARSIEISELSGVMSFPLPAPPPSIPNVVLATPLPNENPPQGGRMTLRGIGSVGTPPVAPAEDAVPPAEHAASPPVAPAEDAPSRAVDWVEDAASRAGDRAADAAPPPRRPRARDAALPLRPPRATASPEAPSAPPPAPGTTAVPRARWPMMLGFALVVLGVGGYFFVGHLGRTAAPSKAPVPQSVLPLAPPVPAPSIPAPPRDFTPPTVPSPPNPVLVPSPVPAPPVPLPPPDAPPVAVALPADGPAAVPPLPDAPPAPTGPLRIRSTPPGADVFLDGLCVGRTPFERPPSGATHRLVLFLPRYGLLIEEIAGQGELERTLEPAPNFVGAGGLRVRCSKPGRRYVRVDGKDTGSMCPTERIHVAVGEHVVGVVDPATGDMAERKVIVRGTRASVRVAVP